MAGYDRPLAQIHPFMDSLRQHDLVQVQRVLLSPSQSSDAPVTAQTIISGYDFVKMTGSARIEGPTISGRRRPFVAAALLCLFPCMGQDADRARQAEKPARQGCGATQLCIDYRRGTIDVERDGLAALRRQMRSDGTRNIGETARHRPRFGGLIDQRQKPRRAGIDGFVKPMAKSVEVGAVRGPPIIQHAGQIIACRNGMIQRHRLLACAPMHIAKHIEASGHRRLQPYTAGGGHARSGNRGGLWPMIDG